MSAVAKFIAFLLFFFFLSFHLLLNRPVIDLCAADVREFDEAERILCSVCVCSCRCVCVCVCMQVQECE